MKVSGFARALRSTPPCRPLQERGGRLLRSVRRASTAPDSHGSGGNPVSTDHNPLTATTFTSCTIRSRSPLPCQLHGGRRLASAFRLPITTAPAVINPTSAYLLNKLIADPTTGGTVLNFLKDASTGGDTDEYVARVDQTINSKQTLFGRFTYWKLLSLSQDPFGTGLCKDRCAENTKSKSLALGYNYAISPNTILNLNASISRFIYLRDPVNSSFDVTQEGWPAAYNALVPNEERTPLTPCFGQNDSLVGCSQGQSAIGDFNTQFNISPQVTMIRGHHNRLGHATRRGLRQLPANQHWWRPDLLRRIVDFGRARHRRCWQRARRWRRQRRRLRRLPARLWQRSRRCFRQPDQRFVGDLRSNFRQANLSSLLLRRHLARHHAS